ncbi:FHA domain-containing protein [Schaalia suimastitidis]|uniref:FHA domain-containing protein n=1 Tax=Schaalia suimastitidis TaxID=121163 RepID=UPI000409A251|nr:FHA domain-containing protein [Schaalia suimastitidis]
MTSPAHHSQFGQAFMPTVAAHSKRRGLHDETLPENFAQPGQRILAYVVDSASFSLALLGTWLFVPSLPIVAIVAAELVVVMALVWARTGRTVGAWVSRIASVQSGSSVAPGLKRAFAYWSVWTLFHITLIGPLLSLVLSKAGRTWLDSLVGTTTVDMRHPFGRNYDAALQHSHGVSAGQLSVDPRQGQVDVDRRSSVARPDVPLPTRAEVQRAATARAQQWTVGYGPTSTPPSPAHASEASPISTLPPTTSNTPLAATTVPPTTSTIPPALTPPAPLPAAATPVSPPVVALDTGERIPLTTPIVIGRAPTDQPGYTTVVIQDATRSLSRTHLRIGFSDATVWVEDTHSANGSSLQVSNGHLVKLEPGRKVTAEVGAKVIMGERTLVIEASGTASL